MRGLAKVLLKIVINNRVILVFIVGCVKVSMKKTCCNEELVVYSMNVTTALSRAMRDVACSAYKARERVLRERSVAGCRSA